MLEERKNKYRVLTNDEFITSINDGNIDLVIDCTLPLVRNIANSFCKTTDPKPLRYTYDELFQDYMTIGMEGVWKATKSFKPENGAHFITFAKTVVESKMKDRHKQFMLGNVEYTTASKWKPSVDYTYKFTDTQYDSYFGIYQHATLQPANEEVDDTFADVDTKLLIKMIEATIPSKAQRKALMLTFGIGGTPMTLKEAGKEMGITYEGVRQLKEKGLAKLQDNKDLFKKLLD